jgi:hypothetical protein
MIASVGLAVSGLAHAATITYNNYTLNPSTNIVTHIDGTEWLQWDQTLDESIDSALSIYASQGWMLASNTQMAGLFADFGFANGTDEGSTYNASSPYVGGTDVQPHDFFIQLFGTTGSFVGTAGSWGFGIGINAKIYTDAMFGSDLDNDGYFNHAMIHSDYTEFPYGFLGPASIITTDSSTLTSSHYQTDRGVALVRVSEVDEPASFAILTLGLIGLGFRRFKTQA